MELPYLMAAGNDCVKCEVAIAMSALSQLMDLAKGWATPPSYAEQRAIASTGSYQQPAGIKRPKPMMNTVDKQKMQLDTMSDKSARKKQTFSKVTTVKEMSRENIGQMPRPKVVGNKKLKKPKYKESYED